MGPEAGGVRGIQLSPGDHVIGAERADEKKSLLTVTEKGYGKRTGWRNTCAWVKTVSGRPSPEAARA